MAWKYRFLNVEEATEYVKYDLTPQQIGRMLSTGGVVLASVNNDSNVYCYYISAEDNEGKFHANGLVCANSQEEAKGYVLKDYATDNVECLDIYEDEELTENSTLDIGEVEECGWGEY